MGALNRTVTPILEPVSPRDVLRQARVDADTSELGIVNGYAVAAREWTEDHLDRSLMPQTWTRTLDGQFPRIINLRRGPLLPGGALTVDYVDVDGISQTLNPSVYQVDRESWPPRIALAFDQTWPDVRRQMSSITVVYQTGYGAEDSAVPQSIRNAMTMLAGYWFDQRFPATSSTRLFPIPWGVEALLQSHRDVWYQTAGG